MRIRDAIALNTCPLLLRIGLAATFLWFGLPKFDKITFTGDAAKTLVELGIGEKTIIAGEQPASSPADAEQPAEPTKVEPPVKDETPDSAQPAGENPSGEAPGAVADDGQDGAAEPSAEPSVEPVAEQPAEPVVRATGEKAAAIVEYTVKARQMENVTIVLYNAGHPWPRFFAGIAMLTEVIGGGLIFIGLFSRVWGLGLAIAMGYAFTLTTWPQIQAHIDPATGNRLTQFLGGFGASGFNVQMGAFFQLMLLLAAWCIFIGGPGAASLDRLIFRRGGSDED